MILRRLTTDFDNVALKMLEQYSWLFEYANNIYDNPKHKEIVKDYPNIKEYEVQENDFLNKAYELFSNSNKDSKLYKKRQKLSMEIRNYLNNYMNFNNIKFRIMLENLKSTI